MRIVSFVIGIFLCSPVMAEYRVYQFLVKSRVNLEAIREGLEQSHMVTSSLDPSSYISYHGGPDQISVDLLRTWVCPGYTGQRAYCAHPYDKKQDQEASLKAETGKGSL